MKKARAARQAQLTNKKQWKKKENTVQAVIEPPTKEEMMKEMYKKRKETQRLVRNTTTADTGCLLRHLHTVELVIITHTESAGLALDLLSH